jgi:hypothetical protein
MGSKAFNNFRGRMARLRLRALTGLSSSRFAPVLLLAIAAVGTISSMLIALLVH